ncbi:hypothetical protein K8T06_15500, partial [bacterium]|nr:hypothetical protein [bacterium]
SNTKMITNSFLMLRKPGNTTCSSRTWILVSQIRRKTLKNPDVHFEDLTGILSNIEEQIYMDSCYHYNECGSRLIGVAVGKKLRSVLV